LKTNAPPLKTLWKNYTLKRIHYGKCQVKSKRYLTMCKGIVENKQESPESDREENTEKKEESKE